MSGCAIRRWGSGTPCTKEPTTEASKELSSALKRMQEERDKQDSIWTQPVDASVATPVTATTSVAVAVPVFNKNKNTAPR